MCQCIIIRSTAQPGGNICRCKCPLPKFSWKHLFAYTLLFDVFILNGICRSVASVLFVLFFCPQIFTEDTPEIETLPRAKVLDYLEKINPRLAIPYLVSCLLSLCSCVEVLPPPTPPPQYLDHLCILSGLLVGGQCGLGQLFSVSIPPYFSLIFTGSHSDGL